jgi:hypothetical protein
MSVIFCPLCNQYQDTDYTNCNAVTDPVRGWTYELICGGCYERLPDFFPEGERDGVLVDGEKIDWSEWG